MKTNNLIIGITTILALHLWYCNADLLLAAKKMAIGEESLGIFTTVILSLVALSYSILSAISAIVLKRLTSVMVFALLDGFAVYMRINVNQDYFILITSVFYAIYTAYLIVICWLIQHENKENLSSQSTNPKKEESTTLTLAAKPTSSIISISDDDKKIYNSAIKRINGSGKNPMIINNIIDTLENENIKNLLIEKYGKAN